MFRIIYLKGDNVPHYIPEGGYVPHYILEGEFCFIAYTHFILFIYLLCLRYFPPESSLLQV